MRQVGHLLNLLLLIVYTTFFIDFFSMHGLDFPSATTAILLMFDVCCVGLRYRVEYNNLYEWLKQQSLSYRFPYLCGSGKCVFVIVSVSGFDDSRPIYKRDGMFFNLGPV